jgi:hypothetical protein
LTNTTLVEVEVFGAAKAEATLQSLATRGADMMPVYAAIASFMRDYEKAMFDTEGAISGFRWAQLSEETLRTKAQKGYPDDIEQATGTLMSSLIDEHAEGHIEEITPEYLRFGTDVEWAPFQYGTIKQPPRELIDFREEDVRMFSDVIRAYVTTGVIIPMAVA